MIKRQSITESYASIKKSNPDCVLLFRMGDFYELLFDDAKVCSKILGLTLISRDRLKNGVDSVAMAGFPYHQLEGYIAKLLHAGKKVAVVESEVS